LPAIEHLVAHLESMGERIARVVDLQPTSPLRESSDIAAALAVRPDADLVVSVCEAADNPYFNLVEPGPDGWVHLSKGQGGVRRQDMPAVYALNGAIYVWRREALARAAAQGMWSVNIATSPMPRWRSVDIDTQEDFEYAEWLYRRRASGAAHG
jgi:N-acylneuraminate cytidylyltransferase